jgi:hypothetical protein
MFPSSFSTSIRSHWDAFHRRAAARRTISFACSTGMRVATVMSGSCGDFFRGMGRIVSYVYVYVKRKYRKSIVFEMNGLCVNVANVPRRPGDEEPKKTIAIRSRPEVVDAIDAIARRDRRSRSDVAHVVLRFGLAIVTAAGLRYDEIADRVEAEEEKAEMVAEGPSE